MINNFTQALIPGAEVNKKLREGNVFTGVSHSVREGGDVGYHWSQVLSWSHILSGKGMVSQFPRSFGGG